MMNLVCYVPLVFICLTVVHDNLGWLDYLVYGVILCSLCIVGFF